MYFRKNDVRLLLDTIYGCNTQNYLLRKYDIYMSYYGFAAQKYAEKYNEENR